MAIVDRINEMYTHVGEVYDTLEVGGAQIYTLPNEFTQVDYLESNGTQYVDTGFKPNQDTRVVIDFIANQRSDAWLLGSRISYGDSNYSVLLWNGGDLRTDYNVGGQDMGASINTRYILDKNKNVSTLYRNGTQVSQITATYGVFNPNHNMYLFACNNNGSVSAMANVKMFSCKIYDNGTLIRDFIPCYRNSDNVIGLYDIVEGNFYTNKGTGVFTYGSVSKEHIDKNIININAQLKDRLIDYMNNGTEKIWNNWEKVTGSGTDISLSPTLEAPMKNVLNGNTYQFTTTGKNLLPNNQTTQTINGLTFTVNDDKSITIRGTATANTDYYFVGTASQYVDFGLTTGTYNLSGCSGGSEQTYMLFAVMNRSGNIYYYGSFVDTGRKMIVETGDTFRIFIRVISGQTMNTTMYPMVERGDNKTTYEPYTGGPRPEYPEDIHVVSGDNTIKVTGKNLLPINLTGGLASGITFTNNLDGTFSARGTSTAGVGQNICGEITLKAGTYTFSVNNLPTGVYLSLNNVGYTMLNSSTLKRIFTLNQDTTFPRCLLWVDSNKTIDTTFEVLLEKGNTATDFEPYSSDLYNIDLPIENLCNVSNTITTSAFGMNVTLSEDVVTCSGTPTRQYINTEAVNLINPLKAGNTYNFMAFSDNLPSECNFRIWGYNSDNVLKFNVKSGASLLITEDIIKYRLVLEGMTTGTSYNIQAKLQIEKGDKFNSYTPYGMEPIKMCNINTYKDYFIKTEGKNLFDKEAISVGHLKEDGTLSTDAAYRTSDFMPIEPNQPYYKTSTGSPRTKYYDKNKQPLNTTTYWDVPTGGSAGTFTIPNDAYYLRFSFPYVGSNAIDINTIMINKGTTALLYEPYGNGEWYECSQIGKAVLNGAENGWTRSGVTTDDFFVGALQLRLNGLYNKYQTSQLWKTNRFVFGGLGRDGTFLGYNGNEATGHDLIGFTIKSSIANTIEDFKNWVSSNNIVFYYILLNSTCTKITYEPLLEQLEAFYNAKSKNSQTNITQENNDLPFIIDSTMLKEV